MVVTLGQQYNVGEKPTVILYTYIVVVFTSLCKNSDIKISIAVGFSPPLTLCGYIGEPLQTMVPPNPFD